MFVIFLDQILILNCHIYSATNSTGATEKTATIKEMFLFFIGLQTTKARLLCYKRDL